MFVSRILINSSAKVMANEIPFGNVPPSMVRNLVISQHQRPSRPTITAAPQLSVDIWRLARRCWSRWEFRRPAAQAIAETLTLMLVSSTHMQPKTEDRTDDSSTKKNPRTSPGVVSQLACSFGELLIDILEDGPSVVISHLKRVSIASGFSTTTDDVMSEAYERCLTISPLKPTSAVTALHLSLNGRSLLVGNGVGVSQWDCLDGVCTPVIPSFTSSRPVTTLTFGNYTNRSAFTADQSGNICRLIEGKGGNASFYNTRTPITCISASTNVMVAFSAQCREIYRWDLSHSGSKGPTMGTVVLGGLRIAATCAAFSHCGRFLFVGDEQGRLSIWVSKTGQPHMRPLDYTILTTDPVPRSTSNVVRCVTVLPSPSSKKVAVGYDSGEIRIWDLETRSYILPRSPQDILHLSRLPDKVKATPMSFSSDGEILAFPSLDERKTVELFNTNSCTTSTTCELYDWPDGAAVHSILVSPDKTRLIVCFEGLNYVLIFCWPGRALYEPLREFWNSASPMVLMYIALLPVVIPIGWKLLCFLEFICYHLGIILLRSKLIRLPLVFIMAVVKFIFSALLRIGTFILT